VDAPDLPPEECEFFITGAGVADTDKVDLTETPGLDFEIETLYEDNDNQEQSDISDQQSDNEVPLIQVKGIGKGTIESLAAQGIRTISDLLAANPEDLSVSISGASVKTVSEWQNSAKALMNS